MGLRNIKDHLSRQPASHKRKYHYTFGDTLGAGAFGVVRKAVNKDTKEEVAVKVILRRKLRTQKDVDDVIEEFRILAKLDHPNIVAFKEWFASKEKFYMVTQLCTGGELFDKIVNNGRFTEHDASVVFKELVLAVKYMHSKNVVHRDIKPENLLYTSKKPDSPLVLCDFGVARELMNENEVIMVAAGSLGYAAPEVFTGEGHGKPVDIWSLGVVLYTMLSGISPFEASTPENFLEECTPGFKPCFHKHYFTNVSDEAKDLLVKMLDYNQSTRLTIDQVAHHPWVTCDVSHPDYDLLPTVKPSLASRKKWRAAVQKVLLAKMLAELRVDENDDDLDYGDSSGEALSSSDESDSESMSTDMQSHRSSITSYSSKSQNLSVADNKVKPRSNSTNEGKRGPEGSFRHRSNSSASHRHQRSGSSSLKDGSRFAQVVLAASAQAEKEKALKEAQGSK